MNLLSSNSVRVFIVLLGLFSVVNGTGTPEERCAGVADSTVICATCFSTTTCTGGVPDASAVVCSPAGTVCDANLVEGICIPPSPSASPICFCESLGCFEDPNDPTHYVNCNSGTEVAGTDPLTTPCDTTVPEQFDLTTCTCQPLFGGCPDCGFYPADNSECSTAYYYCQDPAVTNVFECLDGLCFDTDECHCQGEVIACPACEKYPDPNGPSDGSGFCICGEGIAEPVCGIECANGVFDVVTCTCTTAPKVHALFDEE